MKQTEKVRGTETAEPLTQTATKRGMRWHRHDAQLIASELAGAICLTWGISAVVRQPFGPDWAVEAILVLMLADSLRMMARAVIVGAYKKRALYGLLPIGTLMLTLSIVGQFCLADGAETGAVMAWSVTVFWVIHEATSLAFSDEVFCHRWLKRMEAEDE